MTRRNSRKKATSTIITLELIFLILIVSAYILFFLTEKKKYEDIFLEGTIINEVDCSGLTPEAAKEIIKNKAENNVFYIIFKDNDIESIKGTEIDYAVNGLQAELEEIKSEQRKSIYIKGQNYNLEDFSYNKEKLRNLLAGKIQLQNGYMENMTEINYTYDPSSKNFKIETQDIYYLDFEEVFERVSNSIENNKTKIEVVDLYRIPDKNEILNEMNSFIKAEIRYQLPNGEEYVLDADILYTWLVQNEEGRYIKDEEVWNQKLKEFVEQLSSKVDNTGKARDFIPTGMSDAVCVEGGNYGYLLDKEAEIQMLKEELNQQETITREPCYQKREASTENNGLGTSYVEIDLTRQKVWVYVNGNLEIETDCVTGCINQGHETPTGIFTLTYKETDRVLRGKKLANGKYEYESHVDYWMPFNGGIGLHDATWRSSFGGNIYINDGSHGCINLPYANAQKLYGIIDYEMPIIVYKS